jgi:RimJ/RimL family protein N-acetyltransferase
MLSDTFINGHAVVLRPVRESDASYFVMWVNDPVVREFTLTRSPQSLVSEKEWIMKAGKAERYPQSIFLVIETIDGNKPIGTIGLHNINWIDRNATTGSMIGDVAEQGKGYAVDAKMHLLKYAFEVLGMHKIISRAHADNVKSIRYSERCGYVREAQHKQEIFRAGKWIDIVQLACFYDTWKAKWDEYVSCNFNWLIVPPADS